MTHTAILFLGRPSARGEAARVASWRTLLEASGSAVSEVSLMDQRRFHLPRLTDVRIMAEGRVVPESQAWSLRTATGVLSELNPDVVVFITARAFHPTLVSTDRVHVLDFTDALSRNYGYRHDLAQGVPQRSAFRTLAKAHQRFERLPSHDVQYVTAAGWNDAQYLGAEWVPNLAEPRPQVDPGEANVDVIFFGSLSYLPNVEAVERLGRIWPMLRDVRPHATAILAGSSPHRRVVEVARAHQWDVVADYSRLEDVAGRARLAVFPISYATGIQAKVLEAAAMGLAQVASPNAIAGMRPPFPVPTASTDAEFAEVVNRLLDDPDERLRVAEEARQHVLSVYTAEQWLPWTGRMIGRGVDQG